MGCEPSIKAIIFDFGNVICKLDNGLFLQGISNYTEKSTAELNSLIYVQSDLPRQYETGLIGSHYFFESIVALCKLSITKEEFIKAYTNIFTPIPTTFELIKQLKPLYKLALLSNTSEWDFLYGIKTCGIFDRFDVVTLSYQVTAMKPHRKIFLDALAKLKLKPQECLYIDDIEEYVTASCHIGIHGVLYLSHERLVADLKRMGVLI